MPEPRLLLWLGPPFFQPWLEALGWDSLVYAHDTTAPRTWGDILGLTQGRVPDVLVVADASTPPMVVGVEYFPCLTLFYAVDSHVHSWYPLYAQGFDACLVSLKEHVPLFVTGRVEAERVWWFPPFALDQHRPLPAQTKNPEWDLLFVGTVNPEITPERHQFFTALHKAGVPLHSTRGDFSQLYPKGQIILNEAERGDLNFRVFEALGMGACLLSPKIGHGLTELFKDGEDLVLYPPKDVSAVKNLFQTLLAHPQQRARLGAKGLASIDAGHRASHRAKALHDRLIALFQDGMAQNWVATRCAIAPAIHRNVSRLLYLHWAESIGVPTLQAAYMLAAKTTDCISPQVKRLARHILS